MGAGRLTDQNEFTNDSTGRKLKFAYEALNATPQNVRK